MKPIYRRIVSTSNMTPSRNQLTLFATSSASWSAVNLTYAFFLPSGLKSVSDSQTHEL